MKKTENECVGGCPTCLGEGCKYHNVTRYYCDECGDECTLYKYEGEELCIDCITEKLEVVEGSDW